MSQLHVSNLSVSFGANRVLHELNLSLEQGQLCALLGLNGSGKSTLLRALCGLIPARWDVLTVNGHDLSQMHQRQRAKWLSYLPQRSSVGTGLTVLDVVMMGYNPHLGLFESASASQRSAALSTLSSVGLDGLAERNFDHLSEGQRQLVVFARALVQDAPVMLLDEPDSALDFVHRHQVLAQMSDLVRQRGKSGLLSLHDPNFAMAYCGRLLLLHGGQIAADLSPAHDTAQTLGEGLSLLYGSVAVAQLEGHWMMHRV